MDRRYSHVLLNYTISIHFSATRYVLTTIEKRLRRMSQFFHKPFFNYFKGLSYITTNKIISLRQYNFKNLLIFFFILSYVKIIDDNFSHTFIIAYVSNSQYLSKCPLYSSSCSLSMFAIAANTADASAPLWTPSRLW